MAAPVLRRRVAGSPTGPGPDGHRWFTAVQVAEVKALACELPGPRHPAGQVERADLAAAATAAAWSPRSRPPRCGAGWPPMRSSLAAPVLDLPRDPDFAVKAGQVLDLYADLSPGRSARTSTCFRADEARRAGAPHPSQPPGTGRPAHAGRVGVSPRPLATSPPTTSTRPGDRPLRPHHRHRTLRRPGRAGHDPRALRQRPPVFWIVDNGASHRGWTAAARLHRVPQRDHGPPPVHATWLNQIEIYFSVVQRKVLTPDNHTGLAALGEQLTAFEARYPTQALRLPSTGDLTRDDLDQLLDRTAFPEPPTNERRDHQRGDGPRHGHTTWA